MNTETHFWIVSIDEADAGEYGPSLPGFEAVS